MSVNKVILLGYVGKDPEMKEFESGKVAKMTIATTEKGYKLKSGKEIPDRTEWHNIMLWGGLAEVAEKYINKGMQVYIEGKIQTRSWVDKDGNKHYTTDILGETLQLLGNKQWSKEKAADTAEQQEKDPKQEPNIETKKDVLIDNDLPF